MTAGILPLKFKLPQNATIQALPEFLIRGDFHLLKADRILNHLYERPNRVAHGCARQAAERILRPDVRVARFEWCHYFLHKLIKTGVLALESLGHQLTGSKLVHAAKLIE
jgi:hypothetical protein